MQSIVVLVIVVLVIVVIMPPSAVTVAAVTASSVLVPVVIATVAPAVSAPSLVIVVAPVLRALRRRKGYESERGLEFRAGPVGRQGFNRLGPLARPEAHPGGGKPTAVGDGFSGPQPRRRFVSLEAERHIRYGAAGPVDHLYHEGMGKLGVDAPGLIGSGDRPEAPRRTISRQGEVAALTAGAG